MGGGGGMAELEACHVHASINQGLQHLWASAGWADGGYDL